MKTNWRPLLEKHLRKLAVEIGPRPIGSAANRAAGEYIAAAIDAAGLAVTARRFECPDWAEDETTLELGDDRLLNVVANVYSPPCDLAGIPVPAGTLAELEKADLTGRIALLYGDLTREPLIPKNFRVYNAERDLRIHQLLEEKRPAAVITVSPRPDYPVPIIEEWDFPIPSATVSPEAGLALLDRSDLPVRLRISTHSSPSSAATLVARTPASTGNRVVLCAHYDTKVRTPGALDNGAGAAVLLALAQQLSYRRPEIGMDFVAFADHEYYVVGDGGYADRTGLPGDEILAAINIDGAGYRLGANSLALMAASESLHGRVRELLRGYSGTVGTEPWPQSDHSSFSWWGIPSIAISSTGAFTLSHTPADSIRTVSLDRLAEAAALVVDIIDSLQGEDLAWTRAPQP